MISSARALSNTNVHILGARFGVDAGLPTIASFLNQMRDAADWLDSEQRTEELEAVQAVLNFRHEAAAAGYRVTIDLDNIEDLFSLAVALPQPTVSRNIQKAIGATLNFSSRNGRPREGRMRVSPNRGWLIPPQWRKAANRVAVEDRDDRRSRAGRGAADRS